MFYRIILASLIWAAEETIFYIASMVMNETCIPFDKDIIKSLISSEGS